MHYYPAVKPETCLSFSLGRRSFPVSARRSLAVEELVKHFAVVCAHVAGSICGNFPPCLFQTLLTSVDYRILSSPAQLVANAGAGQEPKCQLQSSFLEMFLGRAQRTFGPLHSMPVCFGAYPFKPAAAWHVSILRIRRGLGTSSILRICQGLSN